LKIWIPCDIIHDVALALFLIFEKGVNQLGKECGKGICQRKDGLYSARFVDSLGKRHDKYFPTLQEAKNWLKQAKEAPTPQGELFTPYGDDSGHLV
jgi:hypothetical protein